MKIDINFVMRNVSCSHGQNFFFFGGGEGWGDFVLDVFFSHRKIDFLKAHKTSLKGLLYSLTVCLARISMVAQDDPFFSDYRVGWDKMSIVGQSESDGVFVSGVTVKELMITGSSILLFLFQLENKKFDLITMGSLIFGRQINIPSDLLCPTLLYLIPGLPSCCTLFSKYLLRSNRI